MSDLAVETTPAVAGPAREAAHGQVVYITDHGERIAAIVPARIAAELERMSPDELAELLEDFADAAAAREARASIEAGEPVVSWEQVAHRSTAYGGH
jgi:antitoxin (DNA-binding transcriptional repressor) of toxin-antitoxin stability system